MKVAVIGTNSFLACRIGLYCNEHQISLIAIGRSSPNQYKAARFIQAELSISTFPFQDVLDCDVIVYCSATGVQAGQSVSAIEIFHVNTFFPIELCESLKSKEFKGKFVSFGSYFEIGNNSISKKYTEDEVLNTVLDVPNDYCRSKRVLTRYFSTCKLPFCFYHFILPTIYGEGEQKHRLIPYLISSFNKKQKLSLTGGQQVRQYLYIGDAVEILFRQISSSLKSGIYNFPAQETLSVRELVKIISTFFQQDFPESSFGKASRVDATMLDLQLDACKLGSRLPHIQLHKIENIIENYLQNELY